MNGPKIARIDRGPVPEVQANIVRRLEKALEDAKAGAYDGGLLIFERADADEVDWSLLGTQSLTRLLGRLELLKHQAIRWHDEMPEKPHDL